MVLVINIGELRERERRIIERAVQFVIVSGYAAPQLEIHQRGCDSHRHGTNLALSELCTNARLVVFHLVLQT